MSRSTIFRDYMRAKTEQKEIKVVEKKSYEEPSIIGPLQNFLRTRKKINNNLSKEDIEVISELQAFFKDYENNRKIVQKAISKNEIEER